MSEVLRVAVVAEGWTDRDVIEAAVAALLGPRPYLLNLLQPEDPLATSPFSVPPRPFGWTGVYRWCREATDRAGRLSADVLLSAYHMVVLHLDADLATSDYRAAHIHDAPDPTNLPCARPCPPPNATTDRLRAIVLGWAGESNTPPNVVLCMPSKNIESWVLAALYPGDPAVTEGTLECRDHPERLLQSKPAVERLVSGGKKRRDRYRQQIPAMITGWPAARTACAEAERFSVDFLAVAG